MVDFVPMLIGHLLTLSMHFIFLNSQKSLWNEEGWLEWEISTGIPFDLNNKIDK